ncbi:lymphocyte antigen 6D-like [Salarias fasciatus]|uniref:lymphocyte antigen 6D-like n=1 Tax=Salarias fasciatus TaxID=181472 RepID=UPI001176D67A|nr:lymphocyte antigen 6D-like [Salarias fasciatus]
MKTVIIAVVVLLVVSQSEALKCHCGGLRHCPNPVETCFGSGNVCASTIITAGGTVKYFKGCMTAHNCRLMNQPGISSAYCCSTDLCNR